MYSLIKIEDTTEKDTMSMRNYIKNKLDKINKEEFAANVFTILSTTKVFLTKKNLIGVAVLFSIPVLLVALSHRSLKDVTISDEDLIQLSTAPIAATSGKTDVIAIPKGTTKLNPFLPYRDIGGTSTVLDVPAYTLVEPPEVLDEGSDAARIMDTVVSGILFDKFSPSAILNIEGNDYLVKKGDVVNNYKILDIVQDSVTVKLGTNIYKAGIGEILTEGSLTHNDVSNLNNKFGGERRQ